MYSYDWRFGRRVVPDEPFHPPLVIHANIPIDDFIQRLEHHDRVPLRWQFEPMGLGRGRVVMYSATTLVHIQTARAILDSIQNQIMQMGADPTLEMALRPPVSLVCRRNDVLAAPDAALVPADAPKDHVPTLVVEIAYTNESLALHQSRLVRWIHQLGVQVVIGVKIYTSTPTLTIIVMQPGLPTQMIEIGREGHPLLPIASFPVGALFRGLTTPLALQGQAQEPLIIDSDEVWRVVQHAQRVWRRQRSSPY